MLGINRGTALFLLLKNNENPVGAFHYKSLKINYVLLL